LLKVVFGLDSVKSNRRVRVNGRHGFVGFTEAKQASDACEHERLAADAAGWSGVNREGICGLNKQAALGGRSIKSVYVSQGGLIAAAGAEIGSVW